MKRIHLFIYLLLFLTLNSCFNNKSATIGFLLPNFTDARYPKDRDYFTAKIGQLGGKVEAENAQNDPTMQETQAKKMIESGVKIIVICAVNQNLAASIVRLAHEHGVIVIAYERMIQNCNVDYFVAFDHYIIGKQQAEFALQKKPSGNYVIICGDKNDKNAELIQKGQMEILSPAISSGKIKVLYNTFVEDWSPESANNAIKRILTLGGEKIDVVLAATDGIAGGAISALDELQPNYPVITTGLDADIFACRRIANGKQSMTVYKPLQMQADMTANLVMNISKGKSIQDLTETTFNGVSKVPTISLTATVVDSEKLRSTVIKDDFYKESEVYSPEK